MSEPKPADTGNLSASARSYLDRVCEELAARSEHRDLIRLVDRWVALGDPSREALLAQARSLVHLRLMDRASLRLKDLLSRDPDDVDVLVLTARLHIERGWPSAARGPTARVAQLAPQHPALPELEQGIAAPPRGPDPRVKEIERSGTPEEQLEQAERFQAVGSLMRARSILERLRRQHGPWSERVEDLLWGLDADSAQEQGDLLALARSLMPAVTTPPDDNTAENTETLRLGDSPPEDEGPSQAFPTLFRRMDEHTADTVTNEEFTSVSIVADRERAQAHEPRTEEDDFASSARDGDTQIMLVVNKSGAPASGHRLKDGEGYNLRETLNLREYQLTMGVKMPDSLDEDVNLEEEDEDLIVVTRRENAATSPEPSPPAGPVEVVQRPIVPQPLPPPPPPRFEEMAPRPRIPPPSRTLRAIDPPKPETTRNDHARPDSQSPWSAAVLGRPEVMRTMLLVALVMACLGMGLVFLLARALQG